MTIMKKNIFLLAVTLLLIGFASCSDEDTKPIIPSDVIDLSADTQDSPVTLCFVGQHLMIIQSDI